MPGRRWRTVAVGSVPAEVEDIASLQTHVVTRLEPLSSGDMVARLAALARGAVGCSPVDEARVSKAQLCGPVTARRCAVNVSTAAAAATLVAQLPALLELWLDEPMLATLDDALEIARTLADLRRRFPRLRFGVHCCGQLDPAVLAATGADVLHIDAALMGDATADWLATATRAQQGLPLPEVVWGIVPTRDRPDADVLIARLTDLLRRAGLTEVAQRSARIAPACGLGTLSRREAAEVMDCLRRVSVGAP